MLSEYLKKEKISIYSLSKETKIPYSTLNDLCNGKVEIDNCKVSLLIKLSETLGIDIKELYKICKNDNKIKVKQYNATGKIVVKNKKYYLEYLNDDKVVDEYLFKVNNTNRKYVKEAAEWVFEDILVDKEMEDLYVVQSNEKR